MRPNINPVENPLEKGITFKNKLPHPPDSLIIFFSLEVIRKLAALP